MKLFRGFLILAIPGLMAGLISLVWRPTQAESNAIVSQQEILHLALSFWGFFGVFFLILAVLARPKIQK